MKISNFTKVLIAATIWLYSLQAYAVPALTPVQTLDFGSLFLRNNNAIYSATISPAGALTSHSSFIFLSPPRNGIYSITGITPSVPVSLSFAPLPLTLSCGCGGADFTLNNFTVSPVSIISDGAGNATFNMGVTLRTSGTGVGYANGAYAADITISVNY